MLAAQEWLSLQVAAQLDAPEGVRAIGRGTSPPFVGVDGVVVESLLLAMAPVLTLGHTGAAVRADEPTETHRPTPRSDLSIGNVAREVGKDDTAPKVACSPS